MREFSNGEIFADRYKIIEKLGSGGMGVVYKAQDVKLERTVALKFLSSETVKTGEEEKRFLREAQTAALLDHPNICTIYEIDRADGQLYIVMSYIEGANLSDKAKAGHLEWENALNIAIQIAEGLLAASEKGIVHRDIKSDNIMITKTGQIKIMDFGLAKLFTGTDVTRTASLVGTVLYMSPEQARGEEVDHRTDIWSLGVVLYEILTGQLPFAGAHIGAVIQAILSESPKPLFEIRDDVPRELERIVLKCLKKSADDRYQTAKELLADLCQLRDQKKLTGKRMEPEGLSPDRQEIFRETEHRQVIIMFAEVSGTDVLQETIEPEEAAALINSCFEMFQTIIEKYGGRKHRIMGNRFSALFGIPVAIENSPIEAVNAAIEMRHELRNFNIEKALAVPLGIHIAINSGFVIAAPMDPYGKEYSVLGSIVDVTSQVLDATEKGKIYVGPQVYRHTMSGFDYQPAKPLSLKGAKEPLVMFELLSEREKVHRDEFTSERMIHSEMVGRNKELDRLELHVLKVINNEGSIVNIIGEAGIGKSTLVAELLKKDTVKKVTLLRGRALSFGKNLSYYPIIDVLKSWANIKEEDSEKESAQKIEAVIRGIYPDGVDEVFPFIATLMGMKLSGKLAERVRGIEIDAMEKLILKNVRELIVRGAQLRPIILVLEDLHWADLSTIELLESLYRLAINNPILYVNVFRPNYKETSDRLLESIRERCLGFHWEIFLEPLDEKDCDSLIHNLLKTSWIPENIKAAISNRTEGNPFFIEEVLRSFIDGGIVEPENGKFVFTEKIESVIIPYTIKEVLMTRIDRLDRITKALLKEASVIGRYFFHKILLKVAVDVEDISSRLGYLQRIQLVQKRKRLEEIEYLFRHALAHEVTYESILLKKRKELHIRVAEAIESVFSDRLHEFYGLLAFHYSRGDEMEKAEEYLLKAGEEALKAAASYEALNYFQSALQFYLRKFGDEADPEKIAGLNKKIAIALYNKGHLAEAVEHFDRALEYWQKKPTSPLKARLRLLADLFLTVKEVYIPSKRRKRTPGRTEKEITECSYRKITALVPIDTHRMFVEAIGLFRRISKYDLMEVENGVAFIAGFSALFSYSGVSLTIGRKILDYVKNYLPKADDRSLFAYGYWKIVCDFLCGDWGGRQEFDEMTIDRMVIRGEAWNATGFLTIMGFIQIELGEFNAAMKCCDKLQDIADAYEDDYAKVRKHYVYTKLLLRSNRCRDVIAEADKGIPFTTKVGQPLAVIFLLGMKANAHILLKELDQAAASLEQAKELVQREKRVSPLMISTYLTSEFLLNSARLEEAVRSGDLFRIKKFQKKSLHSGRKALRNSKKLAAEITKVERFMGCYFWIIGKRKRALDWWKRSIQTGERLGALPELSRSYLEIGRRMLEAKIDPSQANRIKAEEYLLRAKKIFQKLGLERDVVEVDFTNGQIQEDI